MFATEDIIDELEAAQPCDANTTISTTATTALGFAPRLKHRIKRAITGSPSSVFVRSVGDWRVYADARQKGQSLVERRSARAWDATIRCIKILSRNRRRD